MIDSTTEWRNFNEGRVIMKKVIIFLCLAITIGCSLEKTTVIVKYIPTKFSQSYYIDVPIGYTLTNYAVSGEYESQYIYKDSSFIYITNFKTNPNYYNIEALGDSIFHFRFQNEELIKELKVLLDDPSLIPLPDTFELSGQQKSGLYWKDIKLGSIIVGYVNVPKKNMIFFNEAIESVRKTRKLYK